MLTQTSHRLRILGVRGSRVRREGVPQCVERVQLDLSCALSGDSEPVADLVQGLPGHAYAVVGADDDTFAITQPLCQFPYVVPLQRVEHRLERPFGGDIRDQIADGVLSLGISCAAGLRSNIAGSSRSGAPLPTGRSPGTHRSVSRR